MRLFSKTYGNWTDVVVRWESPMKWKYDHIWIDWFLLGVRPHKQNPMGCHTPLKTSNYKNRKNLQIRQFRVFQYSCSVDKRLFFFQANDNNLFRKMTQIKLYAKNWNSRAHIISQNKDFQLIKHKQFNENDENVKIYETILTSVFELLNTKNRILTIFIQKLKYLWQNHSNVNIYWRKPYISKGTSLKIMPETAICNCTFET